MRYSHSNCRLDSLIGKKVRITFKDGHGFVGKLEHHGWRYGSTDCDWFSKDGATSRHIYGKFSFCHSNVKKVEVLK